MKKWSGKRIVYIVMGVIAQMVCFYPWLSVGGRKYNALTYLLHVGNHPVQQYVREMYGNVQVIENFTSDVYGSALALYFQVVLLFVGQLLMLIHLILNVLRKSYADILAIISSLVLGILACFAITLGINSESILSFIYPVIVLASFAFVFLGGRMAEEWNEAAKQEKAYQERKKELRKEQKMRLRFEGKYSGDFYRMIWKNFKYNWKDYRLLTGAGIVSVGLLFVGSGMQAILGGMDTKNDFASGRGMDAVLLNFRIVFIALAVFLITYILIYYLKNRMKSFGVFLTLGIRRKTLKLFIGAELGVSIVISVLGGFLFGNLLLYGFRKLTLAMLGGRVIFSAMTGKVYAKTFGMTVLVFALAFLVTYGISRETNVTKIRNEDVKKEKMPGRFAIAGVVAGVGIIVYAVLKFSKIESAEGVSIVGLFLAGVYLVFANGWGILLKIRKKQEKRYYGTLISKNLLYHKYKRTVRYVFLLTMLHICTFVLFAKDAIAPVIAQDPETELPYDYVCLANSKDDEILEQMKKLGADVREFPMVRATSVDRTVWLDDYRNPILPQGQNIGISESTYYELKELLGEEAEPLPKLDADGSRIYVVYQQDKGDNAKPLDYYMTRKNPMIFIGQPLTSYWFLEREELFMPRTIVGSETGALVGVFREGTHENVIVFSDEYFESIKNNWKETNIYTGEQMAPEEAVEDVTIHEWPTRLVLVQRENADPVKIKELLQTFKEQHAIDEKHDGVVLSYYDKEEVINEKVAERLLNTISNGFIAVILLVISIFILYMKIESELPETMKRYEFLDCMGMTGKERRASIRKEIGRFVWLPLAVTLVSVPVFTALVWKLRHFTAADMAEYAKLLGASAVVYMAVQVIMLKVFQHYVIKKAGGRA